MAHFEGKILPIIQDYQSALLLDYLIEFRDTFIARILSRWLRAKLMLQASEYIAKPLEKRIMAYFDDTSGLTDEYATWHKTLAKTEISQKRKQEFSSLVDELIIILNTAKAECEALLESFPKADPNAAFARHEDQIDRRCECSAETRRIGLAIDHYLQSKQFRSLLRPLHENGWKFGLRGLFSIIPFKVDYPDESPGDDRGGYMWKPGGMFRVLLPKEIVVDSEHVREFLPLLGSDVSELEEFHKTLEKMAEISSFGLREWGDAHAEGSCAPVKYLGTNCFIYTTAVNTCNIATQYAETCLIARNANFVQLVPNPHKVIRGFFQLQSPFPGLVKALFPYREFPSGWNHLVVNGNTLGLGGTDITEQAIVIEMPRSRERWLTNWIEKGSAIPLDDGIPPYCLELIHWIRHSITPWSETFYQQLKNLDEMSNKLSKEITPLISERYRQMLELLAAPLGNLSNALGEMQRDTQELRAVLYDPAKALFESGPRLRDLFEPNRLIRISDEIHIETSHNPEKYQLNQEYTKDERGSQSKSWQCGAMVMLVSLCRIFGVERELSSANDFEDLRILAKRVLRARVGHENKSFDDLWKDLLWMMNDGIGMGDRVENLDGVFDLVSVFEKHTIVCNFLAALKATLFSPFKIDLNTWNLMAVELAIRSYIPISHQFVTIRTNFGWPKFSEFSARSPVTYATLLNFIMGVCLSDDKRKVVTLKVDIVSPQIELVFTESFSGSGVILAETVNALRSRVSPILSGLRDWRLIGANVGDWEGPFIELANRVIGIVPEGSEKSRMGWHHRESKDESKEEINGETRQLLSVISLSHTNGQQFEVSIGNDGENGVLVISFTAHTNKPGDPQI